MANKSEADAKMGENVVKNLYEVLYQEDGVVRSQYEVASSKQEAFAKFKRENPDAVAPMVFREVWD